MRERTYLKGRSLTATSRAMWLFPEIEPEPVALRVPGLAYLADFVTRDAEAEMMAAIDSGAWDTSWERRRQLFGQSYGRGAPATKPLPPWGRRLADQIAQAAGMSDTFEQMLVNDYQPGQGIAMHRDYEPFDRTVASLSLLAPCVMDLRRVSDQHIEQILLERRSLLILSDAARYEWEHGIARRKTDRWLGRAIPRARRVSVTFRRLKDAEPGGSAAPLRPR